MSLVIRHIEKDDTLVKVEVNMNIAANGKTMITSPGSVTMACLIV